MLLFENIALTEVSLIHKTSHCPNITSLITLSIAHDADNIGFVYILFTMTMDTKLRVLELFSGIGGMHYALEGILLIEKSEIIGTNLQYL